MAAAGTAPVAGAETAVQDALASVLARLRGAEAKFGRTPGSVSLLAVSKTKPASAVMAAYAAGQRAFGENHLQDALTKLDAVECPDMQWHFIGPLQSNKSRTVAERFDWVHTIDRMKIARRLSEQRPEAVGPLNVCVQVNVSGEPSKSGVAPEQVGELARAVATLPRIRLRGLMAIPAPVEDFEQQRRAFRALRELHQSLRADGLDVDTLSMGMTDDLEAAIAEGSTMVRIGTAIFGARERRN